MYYNLTLRPEWANGTVSAMNIVIKTDHSAKAGEDLMARIVDIVKIPFCPSESVKYTDSKGTVPVEMRLGSAENSFIYREFSRTLRDTEGELNVSYRIQPRVQPAGYRSSPYFDLVAEKGGVNGAGVSFLYHIPAMDASFDFSLTWDLSCLPEGARGVWTRGSGNLTRENTTNTDLLFSAYMVGMVKSVEQGPAGFYWFDSLPFDAEKGAEQITLLFNYMSKMFKDKGGDYRVFTRHNHFPGGGGTAFPRSYIYAYGEEENVTIEGLQSLLAHEMVHNWPSMLDTPAGTGTWYVEGSAEYYSTIVPMEMGLCSLEKTAEVINDKAASYYTNPTKDLSNMELGKLYWEDRRCQRVPYARGIIYLSNLDAAIRRETKGAHTLLDVELELLKLEQPTPEDFLRVGSEIAGFDLRPGYEEMCKGGMMIPDPEAFGGHFDVTPCRVKLNNAQHRDDSEILDEETDGYIWSVRK